MAVTFASRSNGKVRYAVVVRLQYLRITEYFVPKGVDAIEGDADGDGGDKIL